MKTLKKISRLLKVGRNPAGKLFDMRYFYSTFLFMDPSMIDVGVIILLGPTVYGMMKLGQTIRGVFRPDPHPLTSITVIPHRWNTSNALVISNTKGLELHEKHMPAVLNSRDIFLNRALNEKIFLYPGDLKSYYRYYTNDNLIKPKIPVKLAITYYVEPNGVAHGNILPSVQGNNNIDVNLDTQREPIVMVEIPKERGIVRSREPIVMVEIPKERELVRSRETAIRDIENLWFVRRFPNEIKDKFAPEFFQNIHRLTMPGVLENITLEKFFSLNLAATSLNLIKQGHRVESTFMYHYLLFPHAINRQEIGYIGANVPLLKANSALNIYNILSKKNQALIPNPWYCQKVVLQDLVKVEEEICAAKSNEFCFLKLVVNKNNIKGLTVYNLTGNQNPDFIKLLGAKYVGYMLDCKNLGANNITPNDHVRVVHSERELEILTVKAHRHLVEQLWVADVNEKSDSNKISDYIHDLNNNVKKFENKDISTREFLAKFWQLHDTNIELIMEYKITKNLPQIVSLDDLDRIKLQETEDAYVKTLSNYMQENSETYIILSDLLQNSNKVVREIKTEFLIRFLMKLHPEFFN